MPMRGSQSSHMCTFVHMQCGDDAREVTVPTRSTSGRARPNDPGRKDRILASALDVIAECGVASTTHRRVAERAAVPVGSVTYYFRSLDDLLEQAFAHHVAEQGVTFARIFEGVVSREDVLDALVDLVRSSRTRSRSAVLGFELHLAALRHERLRLLTRRWTRESRVVLARFVDVETAARLDDLLEGMILHELIADGPAERADLRSAIERLLGLESGA
jgi:DNA-binding transcriptional regulator YbjK